MNNNDANDFFISAAAQMEDKKLQDWIVTRCAVIGLTSVWVKMASEFSGTTAEFADVLTALAKGEKTFQIPC